MATPNTKVALEAELKPEQRQMYTTRCKILKPAFAKAKDVNLVEDYLNVANNLVDMGKLKMVIYVELPSEKK